MRHRKVLIIAALLLAPVIAFVVAERLPTKAERDARAAREDARADGFKLEIDELDPPLTTDERMRVAILTNGASFTDPSPLALTDFTPMPASKGGVAASGWSAYEHWSRVAAILDTRRAELDAAQQVVMTAREIRLPRNEPDQGDPNHGLHSNNADRAALKRLSVAFAARAALAARAGDYDRSWSNLLALNRTAARYRPAPDDEAFYERAACMKTAFENTWEAIHAHLWSDAQLAELEAQWRNVDPLDRAEETAMGMCAILLAANRELRNRKLFGDEPLRVFGDISRDVISNPDHAGLYYNIFVRPAFAQMAFRRRDAWLYEIEVLQNFRKRAGQFRTARGRESWREMAPLFFVPPSLRFDRAEDWGLFSPMPKLIPSNFDRHGLPLGTDPFVWIVATETRRRILLAAVAVERARLRLGELPAALGEAGDLPPDFMTGSPLHYRPEPDGTYLIYSDGFDLRDDSGDPGSDIVWPRLTDYVQPPDAAAPGANAR